MAEEEKDKAPIGEKEKDEQPGSAKGGLNAHFKKHWYLYAAGLGAAAILVSIISLKGKANAAQSAGATDPGAVGYTGHVDTMAGGFPDTSNYQSVMSMLNGLNSAEAQNYTLISQLAKNQPVTQPPPPTSGPPATSPGFGDFWATVRARIGSASSAGIGIRNQPGGDGTLTTSNIAYGRSVDIIGPAVTGGYNNPVTKGVTNSNVWYPVKGGGYVSAADLSTHP
jgi:hypothetical protein